MQLEFENDILNTLQPFFDSFYNDSNIKIDSTTSRILSKVTGRKTFIRTDPTYTDLISTGNIDILKDIKFKNSLIEYYQNLERIEKINHNNNIYLNDQIYFPEILKLITFDNELDSYPKELVEISNKIINKEENKLQLINLVNFRKMLAQGSIIFMLEIKTETQQLLDLMNKELIF